MRTRAAPLQLKPYPPTGIVSEHPQSTCDTPRSDLNPESGDPAPLARHVLVVRTPRRPPPGFGSAALGEASRCWKRQNTNPNLATTQELARIPEWKHPRTS